MFIKPSKLDNDLFNRHSHIWFDFIQICAIRPRNYASHCYIKISQNFGGEKILVNLRPLEMMMIRLTKNALTNEANQLMKISRVRKKARENLARCFATLLWDDCRFFEADFSPLVLLDLKFVSVRLEVVTQCPSQLSSCPSFDEGWKFERNWKMSIPSISIFAFWPVEFWKAYTYFWIRRNLLKAYLSYFMKSHESKVRQNTTLTGYTTFCPLHKVRNALILKYWGLADCVQFCLSF